MKRSLGTEAGPYVDRPSSVLYERWIRGGGKEGGEKRGVLSSVSSFSSGALSSSLEERAPVLPLEIIQTEDEQQMELLSEVLTLNPEVIEYYLSNVVFPSTTMQQRMKVI